MKKIQKIQIAPKAYLYGAAVMVVLAVALAAVYSFMGLSRQSETAYLYIDNDDSVDSVMAKLKPMAKPFPLMALSTLARHSGYAKSIHTGRYAINPGEGAFIVLRHLKGGMQTPIRLTVPESRTVEILAGALGKKLMADSLSILEMLTDSAACKRLGYNTSTVPAMFVPNTYEVYWDISPEKLAERMNRECAAFWNKERRQKAEALGISPVEVATLASIIDEETANNAEKPMIAGMYLNRLKIGMPLQADPTVKFALKDFALKRIYKTHLEVESPYNTYTNVGLPPGPVKVASIAGIDAVLNRAEHNYLYMCAKEDFSGTHNFAASYNEHLRNAARYQKALNRLMSN